MAVCGSLQHIFEKPLPENPTLLESLSWNQLKPVKPIEQNSFTEIFGELHFKDSSSQSSSASSKPLLPSFSSSSSSSSSFPISLFSSSPSSSVKDLEFNSTNTPKLNNVNDSLDSFFANTKRNEYSDFQKKSDGYSLMKYESLQLCTEGLGSESSDDVEDSKSDMTEEWPFQTEKLNITRQHLMLQNSEGEFRKTSRPTSGSFPPPISSIGRSGKPWVCLKSYRQDGRFVLKQVRIPTQEILHACREDGRLKLHFVQPNDDMAEEEEDDIEQECCAEENDEQEYEDEQEQIDELDNKCNDDDHEIVDDG